MAYKEEKMDAVLLGVTLALVCFGTIMVFSASMVISELKFHDSFYFLKRQFMYVCLGFVALFISSRISYRFLKLIAGPLLFLSMVSLALVLVPGIGIKVYGARRWLDMGGFSFQPSDLAKFAVVVFMAKSLSERHAILNDFWNGVMPHLVVAGVIGLLIMKEPDMGTCLVVLGIVFLMLFAAGTPFRIIGTLMLSGAAMLVLLVLLEPYRMRRFTAFLNPMDDLRDSDYQSWQALLALGTGGPGGLGIAQSRQKFLYLPQPHTDFIFAIIGEELGFIGCFALVLCFLVVAIRGFRIACRCPSLFGSLLAFGLTAQILIQAFLNMAVVIGLTPVTGVPLPFISYGGTSLLVGLISVGVLLNISTTPSRSKGSALGKNKNSDLRRRNRGASVSGSVAGTRTAARW